MNYTQVKRSLGWAAGGALVLFTGLSLLYGAVAVTAEYGPQLNYAPLWTRAYERCVDAWPADTFTEAAQHRAACSKYASAQVEAAKAR